MNGDLSLSQALGGLRIANPDDASSFAHTPLDRQAPDTDIQMGSMTETNLPIVSNSNRTTEQHNIDHQLHRDVVTMACYSSEPIGGILPSHTSAALENSSGPTTAQYLARGSSQKESQRFHHNNQLIVAGTRADGNCASLPRSSRGRDGSHPPVSTNATTEHYAGEGPISVTTEEWKDRGAAVSVRRELDASGRTIVRQVKKGVRDFSFGQVLGEGSYSTVYLATDRQTLKEYAIKVLEKRHIIKEKKIKYVNIEKNTLNRLTEHPGIVRLYYTFQDETSLYYVLDLCNGGELLGVLKKTGTFDLDCVRFYGSQILDAIEYMHSRGVIHRDLKPENVLLDDQMHVKITDFGTAKLLKDPRDGKLRGGEDRGITDSNCHDDEDGRAASFVGTAEYVSPELLTHKNACKASDLWAFGCIIYQLLAGRPPFKAGSEYLTFQKIVSLEYEFPIGFPPLARDLVERCLVLDPARRLTIEHIKNHEFFYGRSIGRILWRTKAPRLRPYISPAQEPMVIQLNGYSSVADSSNISTSHSQVQQAQPQVILSNGNNRPARIITELPPPTQLDIEWSPVLTRNNERILKLGDLMVISTPLTSSSNSKGPEEGHKKLSRFFGGSTTKKRQRLVMVTSSGRIVLAPAGGEEKRAKQELALLSPDTSWRSHQDAKGQHVWCVDTVSPLISVMVVTINAHCH